MKNLVVALMLMLSSISLATSNSKRLDSKRAASKNSTANQDQGRIKRTVTFILLEQIEQALVEVYTKNDKNSLKKLLESSNRDERSDMAQDLKDYSNQPSFKIVDESLLIITREGTTEFKVEDPFEGKFRLNGKPIRIQSHMSYYQIKKQIEALSDQASLQHPLFDLMIPKANAAGPLAVVAACVRFCVPVATAAGKTLVKYSNPVKKAVVGFFKNEFVKVNTFNVIFICGMTGGQFWSVPCKELPSVAGKAALCFVGFDGKCVEKTEGIQAEIVSTDQAFETDIKEEDNGKCRSHESAGGTRFTKQITVSLRKKEDVAKAKRKEDVTPVAKSKFLLEYQANPSDPEQLLIKSITENISGKDGKVEGQRIWTSDGADFKVVYLNSLQMSVPVGFIEKPKEIVCNGAELKKDECQTLVKHLSNLGPYLRCPFENPAAVVDKLKKETEQKGSKK